MHRWGSSGQQVVRDGKALAFDYADATVRLAVVRAGEDVTFIDFWPAHVDEMKRNGLRITHHEGAEPFTVKLPALHLTEAQQLSKEGRSTSPLSAPNLTTPIGRPC